MKLNNKGITLTEIIISLALISIVLVFIFSLLITVNDINKKSEVNSTYLINKSLILKNIESDFDKAETVNIEQCIPKVGSLKITSFFETYNIYYSSLNNNQKASDCIKFVYNKNDIAKRTEAYLGIYYYKNKESYVISYIHDKIKATRLLPDFEKFNVDGSNFRKSWTLNSGIISDFSNGFNVINIPIIGSDEKDYSINISYYKK